MVRQLLLFWGAAAGCSFQAHSPGQASSDASSGGEAPIAIDASADAIDAPPDAKVYLDAPPVQGSLAVSLANVPNGDVNLTPEGMTDWAHWGYVTADGFDHKNNAASQISDSTVSAGGSKLGIGSVTSTFSWTDGTPHLMASTVNSATGFTAPAALSFTVPAGVTPRTLRVYVGNKASTARFDVSLSDGSATAFTSTQTAGGTSLHLQYTIVFNAASPGQTLTVTWTDTADTVSGGFAMLMAATLQQ